MTEFSQRIFFSITLTRSFLTENSILQLEKRCDNCRQEVTMLLLTIDDSLFYRCPKRGCQARKKIYSSRLPLVKTMHMSYLIMLGNNYNQIFVTPWFLKKLSGMRERQWSMRWTVTLIDTRFYWADQA